MNNKTEVIRVRVTPELKEKFRAMVAIEHRSMSNYAEMLIAMAVRAEEREGGVLNMEKQRE